MEKVLSKRGDMGRFRITQVYEKNKKCISDLIFNFILLTVFYGGMIRRNFNSDTILYMVYSQDDAGVRIRDGRYLVALFDVILGKLGIVITDYMPICILLSMGLLAICMMILQADFEKFFSSEKALYMVGYKLALGLVFTNVLFIEYFMFSEVTLFYVFGFFLAAIGIHLCIYKKRIAAFILFAIAVCAYQYTVVYAAIVLLFYYMLANGFKWSKNAVIDEIIGFVLPLSTGGLNMAALKVVAIINPAVSGRKSMASGGLADKVRMLFDSLVQFSKDSYTLLFRLYIPGIVIVLSIVLAVYLILKSEGAMGVLYFALVLLCGLGATFIIPFLGAGFNFPPRMSFCLYLIQGMIMVTDIYLLNNRSNAGLLKLTFGVVIFYIWLQMLACSFIVSGRFVSNALDKNYARIILAEIEKYEARTGVTVTTIGVCNDGYAPVYYEDSRTYYGQINERAYGQTTRTLIEAMWGRHFEGVSGVPEDVYNEYFDGKDWDYFDVNEQLVIVDDTAYICTY